MSHASAVRASHEVIENVVVQDLTDWDGQNTEGMDDVESAWLSHARKPHVTASITEFGAELSLGKETQKHLAREWSANAEQAGIEKIALVSEGIKARAVSANLDVSQEIRTFQSIEDALTWARD